MFAPQQPQSQVQRPRRSGRMALAELRSHLGTPTSLAGRDRQRLAELASRAARVQGLWGERARVIGLSRWALAAMDAVGGA